MADPTVEYKEDETINEKCGHAFKMITGILTFTTYSNTTTSGVGLDLSQQIPTDVHMVIIEPKGGFVPVYDYENKRIKVYEAGADGGALDECTDSTDLSSAMVDTRFIAFGK